MTEPHLDSAHPQFPDGFPERINDDLLGHWPTPDGMVVVEHHPHGYEVHLGPCYDFENCDACSPARGPSNPHTDDGHHFRECADHGVILTVAGGEVGEAAVLQYLADAGSEPHERELSERQRAAEEAEAARRKEEAEEAERDAAELAALAPSPEERLAALEAEIADLRQAIRPGL
jgi:hypothetical protein